MLTVLETIYTGLVNLFSSPSDKIREAEKKFEIISGLITTSFIGDDVEGIPQITVTTDAPREFVRVHSKYTIGPLQFRRFFIDKSEYTIAVQVIYGDGTLTRLMLHPIQDKYIYVIKGKLIIKALNGSTEDEIILPPEEKATAEEVIKSNLHGWFRIPAKSPHITIAEGETHVIFKYTYPPSAPYTRSR